MQLAKETHARHVGPEKHMQTSLQEIAKKAIRNKKHRFQNLYQLLNEETIRYAWKHINKKSASGVDKQTSKEFQEQFEEKDIGIFAESEDKIISYYGVGGSLHNAFVKQIEEIKIGDYILRNKSIDFGLIDNNGKINGLIGLDILIESGAVVDLKNLTIQLS